jgi:hypothetical protein
MLQCAMLVGPNSWERTECQGIGKSALSEAAPGRAEVERLLPPHRPQGTFVSLRVSLVVEPGHMLSKYKGEPRLYEVPFGADEWRDCRC